MHSNAWRGRWSALGCGTGLLVLIGCAPTYVPKKLEMAPIGTVEGVPTTPLEDDGDGDVTTPNSGTRPPGSSPCSGMAFDDLEETLKRCEVPMPDPADVAPLKGKLEVTLRTSASTARAGGRLDVFVTLRNTSGEPLPLYFTGDPVPRFDVEALDAKGRRADLPARKWPGYPRGYRPEAREAKAARVTLEKNGSARIKVPWTAVKTKWAPERAKVWEGRGHPRVPAGPLARGKYTLRVALPLLGDLDPPKIGITVTP